MIQLVAAVLLVVFGCLGVVFIGLAAQKPYDRFDIWGAIFFFSLAMTGIFRTLWLAFA